MSELLTKTIRRTVLQAEPWHRNNGWYGHIVYFTDGTKGEIYHCTEKNPDWLKEGKTLTYIVDNNKYPNKYADKPFLVRPETIEEEAKQERTEQDNESSSSSTPYRFQKKGNGNGGGGWKGYAGNYENNPAIWLMKQKFISMLKFYEILIPVIIKGDIKYENLHEEVDKHLIHIIEKSGMNNLPPTPVVQAHIPSHTSIQKPAVKNVTPSSSGSSAKKNEDNMMHTSREVVVEPAINPDTYSSESPSTLFDEDSSMKDNPVPAELLEKIKACSKKTQLATLQRSLTEAQLKNRNIMNAFFNQKNKLSNKK